MSVFAAAAAILASGLYAGAAWYVTFVELPSLLAGPTDAALSHWAHGVRRTPRYAVTALIGAAAGLIAGQSTIRSPWCWGALAIFCVLPFTTIAILPLQRCLLVRSREAGAVHSLAELRMWGQLHAVRTALGILANVLFLWAAFVWA
jgi:hypothetical protein